MPLLPKKRSGFSLISGIIALLLIPVGYSYALDVNSIFFVTKSDNGNQVHYGVQVNQDCSLVKSKPAYPYWKLENGRLEGLLSMEVPVFGIASQSVSGSDVVMEINGFRQRGIDKPIMIRSVPGENQGCQIAAFTTINGEAAYLSRIHIDLTRDGFFGIGGTVYSVTFYGAEQNQEKIVCESNCSF